MFCLPCLFARNAQAVSNANYYSTCGVYFACCCGLFAGPLLGGPIRNKLRANFNLEVFFSALLQMCVCISVVLSAARQEMGPLPNCGNDSMAHCVPFCCCVVILVLS